jgi:hypothetical protein
MLPDADEEPPSPDPLPIERQPDGTSCGPTCLHAVYRHFGRAPTLSEVIAAVPEVENGGTFNALLGADALRRGFSATLYTWNLTLFDPTWFGLDADGLAARLRRQREAVPAGKRRHATEAYLEFLARGGRVRFEALEPALFRRLLADGPVIAGLSATYLYECIREVPATGAHDDARGEPVGHFVVLTRYDAAGDRVCVADPFHPNPLAEGPVYGVGVMRLMAAILLGVLTFDGNLLVIRP